MPLAISRGIEKVVVVVVVVMRAGSLGSTERLDWENLREERLATASFLLGISAVYAFRGGKSRCEAVWELLEEDTVRLQAEGDTKGGKEVVGILTKDQSNDSEAKPKRALTKGLPLFVVFMRWEWEVDILVWSADV